MPDIFHKVAGAWKKTSALSVKVAGAWKNVPSAWVKVAGAWKLVYQSGGAVVNMGDIVHALRFRASATTYLNRTFAAPTNNELWTWSGWIKRGIFTPAANAYQKIFGMGSSADGANQGFITILNTDLLAVGQTATASATIEFQVTATPLLRDPTGWYHVHVAFDSNNATSTERVKIWVNGEQMAVTGTFPALGLASRINSAAAHDIGRFGANSQYYDGHIARACFVDGSALPPTDFGQVNSVGAWIAKSQAAVKAIVDAGGANSFMLEFDDAASVPALGDDFSAKGNDWTPTNFSVTAGSTYDASLDTPSNNHGTMSAIGLGAGTLSEAGHKLTGTSAANVTRQIPLKLRGKVYFEFNVISSAAGQAAGMGVRNAGRILAANAYPGGETVNSFGFYIGASNSLATIYKNAASQGTYPIALANAVGMMAVDIDSDKLWFGGNGTWFGGGNPAAGTGELLTLDAGIDYFPCFGMYQIAQIGVNTGSRPFAYTPPAGFLPLDANSYPDESVTLSGSFTGNANADGPVVDCGGVPLTMTINGNAVTWGTHADRLSTGFKLRTAAATHNAAGTNNFTVTVAGEKFKYANAQVNP